MSLAASHTWRLTRAAAADDASRAALLISMVSLKPDVRARCIAVLYVKKTEIGSEKARNVICNSDHSSEESNLVSSSYASSSFRCTSYVVQVDSELHGML